MRGESDSPGSPQRSGPEFTSLKRRRRSRSDVAWGLVVVLLILGGAGAGYYYLSQAADEDPSPEPTQALEAEGPREEPEAEEDGEEEEEADGEEELPELAASDAFVRDLVAELSENPELAAWVAPEDLVHRFVGAVVTMARGDSPVEQVEHLEPQGDFRVRSGEGGFVIDPAAYQRYDVVGETFAALDTQGAAEIYRELSPLFDEAYQELGFGEDGSFDDAFARALGQLLAPQVPEDPVEVEPFDAGYEYRDPDLADLSDAQKHLLRMGPENMAQVQAKLAAVADELEIEPVYR